MAGKIIPIRTSCISPEIVMDSVTKDLPDAKSLYVVMNTEDGPRVWGSGDLKDLAYCSMALQQLAFDFLNGSIQE